MASMDYCVFENTYPDLATCVRKIKNKEELNCYEQPYKKMIYELAKEYVEAYEDMLEEDGN